jgi:hypothetical protein
MRIEVRHAIGTLPVELDTPPTLAPRGGFD